MIFPSSPFTASKLLFSEYSTAPHMHRWLADHRAAHDHYGFLSNCHVVVKLKLDKILSLSIRENIPVSHSICSIRKHPSTMHTHTQKYSACKHDMYELVRLGERPRIAASLPTLSQ